MLLVWVLVLFYKENCIENLANRIAEGCTGNTNVTIHGLVGRIVPSFRTLSNFVQLSKVMGLGGRMSTFIRRSLDGTCCGIRIALIDHPFVGSLGDVQLGGCVLGRRLVTN